MSVAIALENDRKMTSVFERFLSLWVGLCIIAGIFLGKIAPGVSQYLDGLAIYVKGAPVVSIPIAICLFFMMYPIMVKIDFGEVIKAGKSGKPVFLTLFVNWAVKPFTMYGIAIFFLGTLFYHFIGPDAVDLVKMPFGLDLTVGETHGAGSVGGAHRQVQAKGHFYVIHGIRADKCIKKGAEKEQGDAVHGKRLYGPVDKQGQEHRLAAFAGLDHLAEVDFDHDGIHHEKQADGNGDGHHRRPLDADGQAVKVLGYARGDFTQQDAGDNATQRESLTPKP